MKKVQTSAKNQRNLATAEEKKEIFLHTVSIHI
jgi:hypothetical protein